MGLRGVWGAVVWGGNDYGRGGHCTHWACGVGIDQGQAEKDTSCWLQAALCSPARTPST